MSAKGPNKNRGSLPADQFWVRVICGILGFVMVFAIVLMLVQSIAAASIAPTSVEPSPEPEISVGLCYGDSAVQSYTLSAAGGFALMNSSDTLLFQSSHASLIICPAGKLSYVGDEVQSYGDGVPIAEEYHVEITAYAFRAGLIDSDVDNPAFINPSGSHGSTQMEKITANNYETKIQDLLDSGFLEPYTNSIYPTYRNGNYVIRIGQFENKAEADKLSERLSGLLVFEGETVMSDINGFTVVSGGDQSVVYEISTPDRALEVKAIQGSLADQNAKNYNGYFTFLHRQTASNRLSVVNTFSIENYVRSILPYDIAENSPESVAMALAVILRTNAYRMLDRHSADGFDVCTDSHCHVYGGNLTVESNLSDSVEKTKGKILTYEGKPIHAIYNESAGGSIVSAEDALLTDIPYLVSKETQWESNDDSWTVNLTPEIMKNLLQGAGYDGITASIVGITVTERSSESGYVTKLTLVDRFGGSVELVGSENIRRAFGALLPSAKFTVTTSDGSDGNISGSYCLVGTGVGSGMGLSIKGATALAANSYSYDAILSEYYPGTVIESLISSDSQPNT